jgi:L-threonylcarbamoyladenylate synthase
MNRLQAVSKAERAAAIAAAIDVLRAGGVIAYPTDTLYGLAVDPRSDAAIARLFDVKQRDRRQAIPLIAADLEQAALACRLTGDALRVARAFWPGPLSVVAEADRRLSSAVLSDDGTVAVRVPAHALARELASAFGFCITATSANVSGDPPTASADVVVATLADRIDLLLDGGEAPGGPPSTIVAFRGGAPSLVRAGAIAWERVLEFLE